MRRFLLGVLAALLVPAQAFAQSREETEFVAGLFARLQLRSFDKRREYCGFIGRDASGALRATPPWPENRES